MLLCKIALIAIVIFLNISSILAFSFSSKAKSAIVIDFDTQSILYSKNANEKIFPASMSKLMTLYILFEEIQNGTLALNTKLSVSKKAWKKGGSKMFLEPGKEVTVMDILKGIIIQSGNDACIVVAENIAGDEDNFADLMNDKAEELGLKYSNFTNSTGWPDESHYMSASDLAILSSRIIKDFPEFFYLFKEKSFKYNNISQNNRNPLLYSYKFADGLKTGYTEASGYSLAATAYKNKRRLILIVSGLKSEKERKQETEKLFKWAYKNFMNIRLFNKNEIIQQADVWIGKKAVTDLYSNQDILFTIKKEKKKKFTAKVVFNNPIIAPINLNTSYGKVIVTDTVKGTIEYPLYSKEEIDKAGFFKKITTALSYVIFGGYAE
ncbi:D-alanyl-D-alanine carboxypeptidase [Alphaproteobacteria bacterium]|nr:D-alanyl-D-alanine carboxypeptidase [Alphaproteobacteria bacterium]